MEDMMLNCVLPEGIEFAYTAWYGLAINSEIGWRCYNGFSNEVITFDDGKIHMKDEKASMVIVKKPEKGTLIIYNDEGYFVEKPLAKCVIAFHAESGKRRIVPPTKTEEGFVFFKIKSYYETLFEHADEFMPRRFEDSSVAYSIKYGTAVKCGENWRIYWKETKEVATLRETLILGSSVSDEAMLHANSESEMKQFATRLHDAASAGIPVLSNMGGGYLVPDRTPSEGDLVKYKGEYYFVVRMIDSGIEALEVKTGVAKIIPPTKNFLGDSYWRKVVTLEEASYNKQTRQIDFGIIFSYVSAQK